MEITKQEEQVLETLQHYPKLKLLEVWKTMEKRLENNDIKPLFSDYHYLRTNCEETHKLLQSAVLKQKMISQEIHQQKEIELNKFYDIIRNNRK